MSYKSNIANETSALFTARSHQIGVEVVRRCIRTEKENKFDYFINVEVSGSAYRTLGPYAEPITMPQALLLVGTEFKLAEANGEPWFVWDPNPKFDKE